MTKKKYNMYNTVNYDCPVELDWLPVDTKERFAKTSKEHQEDWNQQPSIKYSLNKYGFRSDEFPEEECRESITFIGCSNTLGIGVRKEDTWTYKLAKELGLTEINLGISAGSTDSAFRVYNEWQPIHKSKITCFLLPPSSRMELIDDKGNWLNIGHWALHNSETQLWLGLEAIMKILDDDLNSVRTDRNMAAISWIAHQTDSKLIVLPYNGKFDTARDNMHMGIKSHELKMLKFLEEINK